MSKFEVDTKGFAQLQAGREPWRLAKELVSNAYDEREVTKVKVDIFKEKLAIVVRVEDDGPGFRDLKDAYTLYAWTYKREDPTTRGRFNLGEKEILALAKSGSVKTTSGTVSFNEDSREETHKKGTKKGTIVTVYMNWSEEDMEDVIDKLQKLIPPKDKTYTVNGLLVPQRKTVYEVEATLETVLLAPDGLMRPTRRKTTIKVYDTLSGETPMLFEMGIPVQELDKQEVPWHLDVQQKIPLAPNRDAVRPAYLQDVLAEVLNATAHDLNQEQASGTWVKEAIGDERVSNEAVKQVFDTQYEGRALVGNPLDPLAMERAQEHGMIIIHPRSLTAAERARLKETGAIKNVSEVYKISPSKDWKPVKPNADMERIEAFVHRVAKPTIGHDIRVQFVNIPNSYAAATCGTGTLTFVVNTLGKGWFEKGLTADVIGLIAHELAHEISKAGNPHGLEYHDKALPLVAGRLALLARDQPKLFKL